MKTLIVYATHHGNAQKIAHKLAGEFGPEAVVEPVRNITSIDLDDYENVIIGCSIHAGRIQREIKTFTKKYQDRLLQKRLGLFICHMDEIDKARTHLENNFPPAILEKAVAKGFFGGEFNFDKMNFIERAIVKKVAKVEESVSNIRDDNVADFIKIYRNI